MIDVAEALRATLRREAERVALPRDFDARVLTAGERRRPGRIVLAATAVLLTSVTALLVASRSNNKDSESIVSIPTVSTTEPATPAAPAPSGEVPSCGSRPTSLMRTVEQNNLLEIRFSTTNTTSRPCQIGGEIKIEVLIGNVASYVSLGRALPMVAEPLVLAPNDTASVSYFTTTKVPGDRCAYSELPPSLQGIRAIIGESVLGGESITLGEFICVAFITPLERLSVASVEVRTLSTPLGKRWFPHLLWTGNEVLLWGGDDGTGNSVRFDGVLIEPATGGTRPMAPSPIRSSPVASAAADPVLFFGSSAASFEPSTNSWRSLDAISAKNAPLLVSYGGSAFAFNLEGNGALTQIDVRSGQHVDAARPPKSIGSSTTAVKAGIEMIVLEGTSGQAFNASTGRWRELPTAPIRVLRGAVAVRGDTLLAFGVTDNQPSALTPATYDATSGWQLLPATPVAAPNFADVTEIKPAVVWLGNRALLLAGGTVDTRRLFVIDLITSKAAPIELPAPLERYTPLAASPQRGEAYALLATGELAAIKVA